MQSRVPYTYDATLAIEPTGSAAITAASSVQAANAVNLNKIVNSWGGADNGLYGETTFAVVVFVSEATKGSGNETFTLNFQSGDANGANLVTQQAWSVPQAAVGKMTVFNFDTASLSNLDANAETFTMEAVVAGTTPTFEYWAFVAPVARY